jgi:hypothetical protein
VTTDHIETSAPAVSAGQRAVPALATARARVAALLATRPNPPAAPFPGWVFLWQPALLGFAALVAIAVGSSFSDSPFKLEMPSTWFFGVPTHSVASFAPVNSTTILFGLVLVYGGIVALMRVWIRLSDVVLAHPGAPLSRLMWMLALWTLPMLVIAPILSRDVFSYAAQGEMVTRHINPYRYGPATLGSGPYVAPVDSLWSNVPAPYGPLFLSLDGWIVQLSGHNQMVSVIGLRLLEVAAVALLAWTLPMLAKSLGYDPGYAFVMGLLNPLVVLTIVGGAHNDGLMVALLVAGLALAMKKHPVWGIVVCAMAASIKAPAALGIVYIAWEWLGPDLPVRQRLRPLAVAGIVGGAVLGVLTMISGLGFGWVANLATPGTVRSWEAPATGLGMLLAWMCRLVGFHVASSTTIELTRGIGLLAAGVLIIWLLFNADRLGWLKALGLSMLAIVLLGPVVQPWYLTWGLVLLAPVAVGRLRTWMIVLSVVSPFVGLPGGRELLSGIVNAPMVETAAVLLVLWAVLLAPMGRWTTYGQSRFRLLPA